MMPIIKPTLKHLFAPARVILHWALPPVCVACSDLLQNKEEGLGICASCWGELPVFRIDEHPEVLLPKHVDSFMAPMLYEDEVQRLVKQFKFNDTPELSKILARLMLSTIQKFERTCIVMPVPMHHKRLFQRQFNQSAMLAKSVGCLSGHLVDVFSLKRIRATAPQVGKSESARRRNLQGAFEVGESVKGKDIILIDDVWTTGSTAAACARVLKHAGAKTVNVVTLCYVPK